MSVRPVVLVTGAGRGLGRAVCERFRADGYVVVATDREPSLLADLDEGYVTSALDVTDPAAIDAVVRRITDELGRLDVVVNNAGVIAYFPVAEMDPDAVIRHFEINAFGALRVVHACLDLLVESRGRVVNVTSESYRLRTPFQIYQSTKLALEGISDVLRRELAVLGVHVATVRPGAIATELFHAMDTIENPVPDGRLAGPFASFVRGLAKNKPTSVSTPAEVAAVVHRAATDPRRRPHYEINNMRALKVAAALPPRMVDVGLRRMIR